MANSVKIVQGQDKTFYVNLSYKETQLPFDLSSMTGASGKFPNADGTVLVKSYPSSGVTVDGAPGAGRLKVVLSDAETALLLAGDGLNMEFFIDVGSTRTIFQMPGELLVDPQLL